MNGSQVTLHFVYFNIYFKILAIVTLAFVQMVLEWFLNMQ